MEDFGTICMYVAYSESIKDIFGKGESNMLKQVNISHPDVAHIRF